MVMGDDLSWEQVSDEDREDIRSDVKKLLGKFSLKLEKVKAKDVHFENGLGFREEGSGWNTAQDFREIMFANAPFVEDDAIVAERGGWK